MPDPFPSCFRGSTTTTASNLPTTASINSNLTTCLYQTAFGVATVTWCRNILGHALHIDFFQFQSYHHHHHLEEIIHPNTPNISSLNLHLHLNPWLFWRKQGSKSFHLKDDAHHRRIDFFWDLSRARFLSAPQPDSSFYVTIVVDGEMVLLLGDLTEEAYFKTAATKISKSPAMIMRREHMFGSRSYKTRAQLDGKTYDVSIDCSGERDETKLLFSINGKKVLQVKRLKWKFRGNERIEIDGTPVQVSWDVYNWLFDDAVEGHAVFMFRFEKQQGLSYNGDSVFGEDCGHKGMVLWQPFGAGATGMEGKRKKSSKHKSLLKTGSSSSSSSASSGSSSSVMEWASMEDNEMERLGGFSLMVYAWKS
ncbi:hypothetical protein ACLOJK_002556 [Asimina triloba]